MPTSPEYKKGSNSSVYGSTAHLATARAPHGPVIGDSGGGQKVRFLALLLTAAPTACGGFLLNAQFAIPSHLLRTNEQLDLFSNCN